MNETTKEKLAWAEYWSLEARNEFDPGCKERELLEEAHSLIKKAMALANGQN